MSQGQGKPGFCKICVHPGAQFINARREREGEAFNARLASDMASSLDPDFKFTRQTWYAHLDHITHPLVTAVEKSKRNPVITPKTTTGVLESIRDMGMQNAIENPETVTVDHALKAATELNRKGQTVDEVVIVMAKVMSGQVRAEEIVGEWREVPALETQEDTTVVS